MVLIIFRNESLFDWEREKDGCRENLLCMLDSNIVGNVFFLKKDYFFRIIFLRILGLFGVESSN